MLLLGSKLVSNKSNLCVGHIVDLNCKSHVWQIVNLQWYNFFIWTVLEWNWNWLVILLQP